MEAFEENQNMMDIHMYPIFHIQDIVLGKKCQKRAYKKISKKTKQNPGHSGVYGGDAGSEPGSKNVKDKHLQA